MTLFAIRDDDTAFFTAPEELERVYKDIWGTVPISLAVVPFSVSVYRENHLSHECNDTDEHPLDKNPELIAFLKSRLQNQWLEIMLHGFSHQYRQINGRWYGEFAWKSPQRLQHEVRVGKAYLEKLLDTTIKVFVPPSNQIGRAGIQAIAQAGLNLSGIMGRGLDRPFSGRYIKAYTKRWTYRLMRGRPYPFVVNLGTHKELIAYSLTPLVTYDKLKADFDHCNGVGAPFVLATHYWEVNRHAELYETLHRLIDYALKKGARPVRVSECFREGDE